MKIQLRFILAFYIIGLLYVAQFDMELLRQSELHESKMRQRSDFWPKFLKISKLTLQLLNKQCEELSFVFSIIENVGRGQIENYQGFDV